MLKARLGLEQFEAREVPALFTWWGMYGTDATDPRNWSGGAGVNLPGPGDDLLFATLPMMPGPGVPPPPSAPNCVGLTGTFGSINITSSYTSTVTFGGAVTVNTYTQAGGAISQPTPSTTDLTVLNSFTWTGGTLNSAASNATVRLQGAIGTINPGTGNTITTKSTLSLEPRQTAGAMIGAAITVRDGTVDFAGGLGVIIDNLSVLTAAPNQPPAQQRPKAAFNATGGNPFGSQEVLIKLGGTLNVTQGDFDSNNLPLKITGGTFTLTGGDSTAKFSGAAEGIVGKTPSVLMQNGTIKMMQGTTLTAVGGTILTKQTAQGNANLFTLWNPVVDANQAQPLAKIVGDLDNRGADVAMCVDQTNRLKFGTLKVEGNVTWSGGTYRPVVYAPGGNPLFTDLWSSTGEFTINAGAKLAPGTVSANGTANTQQPTVGQEWTIILSDDRITLNNSPPVEGKWKVVTSNEQPGNVVKRLRVEGIA